MGHFAACHSRVKKEIICYLLSMHNAATKTIDSYQEIKCLIFFSLYSFSFQVSMTEGDINDWWKVKEIIFKLAERIYKCVSSYILGEWLYILIAGSCWRRSISAQLRAAECLVPKFRHLGNAKQPINRVDKRQQFISIYARRWKVKTKSRRIHIYIHIYVSTCVHANLRNGVILKFLKFLLFPCRENILFENANVCWEILRKHLKVYTSAFLQFMILTAATPPHSHILCVISLRLCIWVPRSFFVFSTFLFYFYYFWYSILLCTHGVLGMFS